MAYKYSRLPSEPISPGEASSSSSTSLALRYPPNRYSAMSNLVQDVQDAKGLDDDVKEWGTAHDGTEGSFDGSTPTEDELDGPNKLRRVSDNVPWGAFLIAFVEGAERFSYYGTSVVFTNFIQRPLPPGSRTGAGGAHRVPGALGLGTQASTGITNFNTFWGALIPLLGAYLADAKLGRFEAVCWSIPVVLVGHILLIICAIPAVIVHPHSALACFIIALIILATGTGAFKANVSPLVAEQYKVEKLSVKMLPSGERVIVDPAQTHSRIYLWFYLLITIGTFLGQLTMTYAAKYVGFWLAFTLPTILFLFCPIVLWIGRERYRGPPPKESVVQDAVKVCRVASKGHRSWNVFKMSREVNWDQARPDAIIAAHGGDRPAWLHWDSQFVDEVRRAVKACQVFLLIPLYRVSYGQLHNNLVSQAATMTTHGVPNDVLNNLNPFTLIIAIPVCDYLLYPALRRAGINFTPLKRMFLGFELAAMSMVWAAVVQYYIYQRSECGYYANNPKCAPTDLNVWIQSGSYILMALSDIFVTATGYEYAFQMAPKRMRSVIMAFNLFVSVFSSALAQAFVPLAADPLLIWNYGTTAMVSGGAGFVFWFCFRGLDAKQDEMNQIGKGKRDDDD